MSFHGQPCWFELGTSDLEGARTFYEGVLRWQIGGTQMPDFDYRLARANGPPVAGLMPLTRQPPGTPPNWLVYVAVGDADEAARSAVANGARVLKGPEDIPGTGRYAVIADPQGAAYGILQPAPMDAPPESGAFDQSKAGHGNWIELMTPDPEAAFGFYAGQFGWTRSTAIDMGEQGTYRLFARDGADIGGMMRQGQAPVPAWFPYFGVNGLDEAVGRVADAGGSALYGPMEVPGGAFTAMCADPQGAVFAMVGPKARAG